MSSRIPKFLAVSILCGCFLFSQRAYAQAPSEEKAPPPAAQTTAPAQPSTPPADKNNALPAPMDKDLSFLLGKWETKIKIFPNPLLGNTDELKGGGTAEYQIFGETIEGSLANETSNGKYEFKEFIWYDQAGKAYNIISISSEGYAINKTMMPTKSSEKFVIQYAGVHKTKDGKEVNFTVQAKYKIISDTEVKYFSEVKLGKADFVPFIQIKMQRVSK